MTGTPTGTAADPAPGTAPGVTADDRTALPTAVPLDRAYDAERLAAEARALRSATWRAQRAYGQDGLAARTEVDWRILSLRGPGGDPDRTDPGGAGLVPHADTPHLERAPYTAEVLRGVPAPLRSVRLMALGPGARVHEHRDGKCGHRWGALRLHVPVITNPGAVVVIGGEERHWDAGRLWFGDFDRPHHVRNGGAEPRVHLVIDTMVTPALLELFPAAYTGALRWSEVLFAREPVPLGPAEAASFRCRFALPAAFPDWSEEEPEGPPGPDLPGAVDLVDGRLALLAGGEPLFALVHLGLGEFRLEGWTEERTLHIDLAPPEPRVRFRVRRGGALSERVRPARPIQEGTR
ncbi:aspartyl/asparaginyl beta-hydroxylase domain-containing protein [Spirillospora sp. NPDC050679]